MTAATYSILRVRPRSRRSEGLPRQRLHEIGTAVVESQVPVQPSVNEKFSYADDGEFTNAQVDILQNKIERCLNASDLLILDCGFADHARGGFVEVVLPEALIKASARWAADAKRVLIILEQAPAMTDALTLSISGVEQLAGACIIACLSAETWSASQALWSVGSNVTELVVNTPFLLRKAAAKRIVRRRGVFSSGDSGGHNLTAFRWNAAKCVDELAALLLDFANNHGVKAFIYDQDGTIDWFYRLLQVVGAQQNFSVRVISTRELQDPSLEDDLKTLNQQLLASRSTICLAVPMYKSGATFVRLAGLARKSGLNTNLEYLAIMADADAGVDDGSDSVAAHTVNATLDGVDSLIRYFVPVKHEHVSRNDWLFRVADTFGEIESDDDAWVRPSTTGMLSLFDHLTMGLETPVPDGRPPVKIFPQLLRLEDADAHWLAECMVRLTEHQLGIDRTNLLIIVPNEESGSTAIAQELENTLDVAVLRITRAELADNGLLSESARSALDDYKASYIAAFDESAVGGSTLDSIDRFVIGRRGKGVDLRVVAVHAPLLWDETDSSVAALYRWKPFTVGQQTA